MASARWSLMRNILQYSCPARLMTSIGMMSAHAAPAAGGLSLSIRGRSYPVVLPKLSDPRLHLAAVITTLQVLGQVEFHLSLIHISEPTRRTPISYAVFCL